MAGKPKQSDPSDKNIIRSVAQALRAFDFLEECGGEAGVTEVADALGLHKSTASRLLATLNSGGYVTRNELTGRYTLGMRLVELAKTKLELFDIRSYARPFLEELAQETKETVHLAIMEEDSLVYLDKIDTPHTLTMRSQIGGRLPAHCTALGKAILSVLPETKTKRILQKEKLERFAPNTITDPLMFAEHLRQVKAQGFAIDDEENEEGIRCAASVIKNHVSDVVGAISVSGPVTRVSRQRAMEIGVLVKEACQRLSKSLGYRK